MAYLFGNWRPWVLRRLENIVCYSAVRMRRMTQYTASGMRLQEAFSLSTPYFLRALHQKQHSVVFASLTRRFDQKDRFSTVFFSFCRSRWGLESTSRIFAMLALCFPLIFVSTFPRRELGIAARGLFRTNCSAFDIVILLSARWARYRAKRYAAFAVEPQGARS